MIFDMIDYMTLKDRKHTFSQDTELPDWESEREATTSTCWMPQDVFGLSCTLGKCSSFHSSEQAHSFFIPGNFEYTQLCLTWLSTLSTLYQTVHYIPSVFAHFMGPFWISRESTWLTSISQLLITVPGGQDCLHIGCPFHWTLGAQQQDMGHLEGGRSVTVTATKTAVWIVL